MIEQANNAPAEIAQETVPGVLVLLQVWWALAWRQFLWMILVVIAIVVVSFIISFVIKATGADPGAAKSFGRIFGFLMGILGGAWTFTQAFRFLLGKEFSGHKLLFLAPKNRA